MLPLRAAGAALLLLLLVSCREPEAGLHVEIDGPLQPGTDFDRLALVAYLAADRTPLYAETLDAPSLPVSFNLVSGPGTPEGTEVEVLASAEKEGEVVSAVRGVGVLQRAEGGALQLQLPELPPRVEAGVAEACDDGVDDDGDGLADCADPDCESASCASGGQQCVDGACGCPGGAPLGVWSTFSPGFLARSGARAIAIDSGPATGAVLIAGGVDANGEPTAAVELYRPGLSLESLTLQSPRTDAALLVTQSGAVHLAGGAVVPTGAASPLPIESLDLESRSSSIQALTPPRGFEGAHALPWSEGWFVFGGSLGETVVALTPPGEAETDWTQSTFATLGTNRRDAVMLEDGRLLFASGPDATDLTELLSTDGGVGVGPRLPEPRANAALAPLPGGAALVVGGIGEDGEARANAYVISSPGGSVSVREVGALHQPIAEPVAYALGNGWIYVESRDGASGEWFDPASERFVRATPPPERTSDAALAVAKTRVFRSGGLRESDGAASDQGAFLEPRCAP